MRLVVRAGAVLIAIGGVVDPAVTRDIRRPVSVEVAVPPASDPDHSRATAIKEDLTGRLQDVARFDDLEPPAARLAIGHARVHREASLPLFMLPLEAPPIQITRFRVPAKVMAGQLIDIDVGVRARNVEGRTSEIRLQSGGVTIASARHRWSRSDESHGPRFVMPGQMAGLHRVSIAVTTDRQTVTADAHLIVRGEPLRVLVYEPRPSWPVTFARRSLEADARFDVHALSRNAPGRVTRSGARDLRLNEGWLQSYEALLLGAVDALSGGEIDAVMDFMSRRGGTAILLPDGRLPEPIRARLQLPVLQEVLLEEPATVETGALKLKASELLFAVKPPPGRSIASLRRDGVERPVIFAGPVGQGTMVFSGALDAWRYRSADDRHLDAFVRSLTADGALRAPSPIEISLSPNLARTGEPVSVTAVVRQTAFAEAAQTISVPPVSAAVTDSSGRRRMIRLWPTARLGEFTGSVTPAEEGAHVMSVTAGSLSVHTALAVASDVTHARTADHPGAAVAAVTGGAVVADENALLNALASLDGTREREQAHPMRSPWWIVPFTVCLATEWALRRRAGFR